MAIILPHPASPPDEPTDAHLIQCVQRGDHAAFSRLVQRHLAAVRAFIAMKLPVLHLADELTHEAFVFAFRNLSGFELKSSFRAWLRAIAYNLVRRELLRFARERQNLSRLEQVQVLDLLNTTDSDGERDEAIFLEECLGKLSEPMRRLVQDRYHSNQTSEEMAAAWQRSAEWVRVTLLRVRRQLRECIELKMEASHGH